MSPQVLYFLEGNGLAQQILPKVVNSMARNNVNPSELEPLYDWLVTEAIQYCLNCRVVKHVKVSNHLRNDLYRIVYEDIGYEISQLVWQWLEDSRVVIVPTSTLKILITQRDIIIALSEGVSL